MFKQIAVSEIVPGKARWFLYDTGHATSYRGRYIVSKHFKDKRGRFRMTQKDFHQKPAALRFAAKWLDSFRAPPAPSPSQTLAIVPYGFWDARPPMVREEIKLSVDIRKGAQPFYLWFKAITHAIAQNMGLPRDLVTLPGPPPVRIRYPFLPRAASFEYEPPMHLQCTESEPFEAHPAAALGLPAYLASKQQTAPL